MAIKSNPRAGFNGFIVDAFRLSYDNWQIWFSLSPGTWKKCHTNKQSEKLQRNPVFKIFTGQIIIYLISNTFIREGR